MDFKAQIIEDLKTFHNPEEFAEMMCIWYDGQQYEAPAVLDHLTGTDRQRPGGDNAEGYTERRQCYICLMRIWELCRKKGVKLR